MRYRREIDGLRSIAVVPVILFHAGFSTFSGGFVGVDVFFVISGYLITRIIISELVEGRFSVIRFYERRARRILPALFFVILCCIPFAWMWMLPDPLENFGQSVVATVLFANNILLAKTSGYWDLAAEFKPLLHTWSLAVEEQYYILFPLLLIAVWRFGLSTVTAIVAGVAVVSFLSGEWGLRHFPDANFYLAHGRAWELLVGSLCAFFLYKRQQRPNEVLSFLGLALIVASIFLYDETTPFPSIYTLVPVLGTALIILFGSGGTWCARVLSVRILVAIGLISYSLYLWHQPVLAFARINSFTEPSRLDYLLLICLIFVLAGLSWRYVEQPFRNRDSVPTKAVLPSAVAASVVLCAIGMGTHLGHGFPTRFAQISGGGNFSKTYIDYNERIYELKKDRFSDDSGEKILVLGNSFARDFANMLIESPLFQNSDIVYRDDMYFCVNEFLADGTKRQLLRDSDLIFFASGQVDFACMQDDLAFLESIGVRAFIVGGKHFGYNLSKFARLPNKLRPASKAKLLDEIVAANEELKSRVPPEVFVDIIGALSDDGRRVPVFDGEGRLLSGDRTHLTQFGAIFVGRKVLNDKRFEDG
jgi:peptidoglycan/LPS O-acetylase OafA/YrhL